MEKVELDKHIEAMVGKDLVELWWSSPNKHWNGFAPIEVYETDEHGKVEVERYIMLHCYGGW